MNNTLKAEKNKLFHISYGSLVLSLVIILFSIAIYSPVINFSFVNYDDNLYVFQNNYVKSGLTIKSIKWAFTSTRPFYWHPFTWLSHMLDVSLFGLKPGIFHLINLIFHIINSLLLFFILKNMTKCLWQSFFVAALFTVHPMHVESVCWISERKDVLFAFFFMLTIAFYIKYTKTPNWKNYLFVVIFFVFSLMSKTMAITLPFVLLLLDYWPLCRMQSLTQKDKSLFYKYSILFEKIPLIVFTIIGTFITYWAQKSMGAITTLTSYPLTMRIDNAIFSYIKFIKNLFLPYNLSIFYSHPGYLPMVKLICFISILVIITYLVIKYAKKSPWATLGWFWFLGILFPVIGLVQVGSQAMADRYTYIPFIGLYIIMVWCLFEVFKKVHINKNVTICILFIVLIYFTVISIKQVRYWKNSITLFEHAALVDPKNTLVHYNLGNAYYKKKMYIKAIEKYKNVLSINKNHISAYLNMGSAEAKLGNFLKAKKCYLVILRISPNNAKVYNNLGLITIANGKRIDEAIDFFQKAIKIKPNYWEAQNNLRKALLDKKELTQSLK